MSQDHMAQGTAQGIDKQAFRQALGRFASGVTIITAAGQETRGMTANAFVSVSLEPPLILISVSHKAVMHELLQSEEVTHFGVNILSAAQQELSDHFAGKPLAEDQLVWQQHQHVPLIGGAIAHLVCRKHMVVPAGDHTLYIGLVEYSRVTDEPPLLYFQGQYQRLAEQSKP